MTTIDRTSLIVHQTTVRMTPPPASRQFREVLARGGEALLQGAVAAAQYVPGGNILAAAVRGAGVSFTGHAGGARTGSTGAYGTAEAPAGGAYNLSGGTAGDASAAGGSSDAGALGAASGSADGSSGAGVGGAGQDPQDNDMLARSQEMSMRMLRLQEAMGEENRRYTALSNVLHARHEMAKNAIGNIR